MTYSKRSCALMRGKKRKFLNEYLGVSQNLLPANFFPTAAGALIGTWNRWSTCSCECFTLWREVWLRIIAPCGSGEDEAGIITIHFKFQRKKKRKKSFKENSSSLSIYTQLYLIPTVVISLKNVKMSYFVNNVTLWLTW